jgi:hypothetical protein
MFDLLRFIRRCLFLRLAAMTRPLSCGDDGAAFAPFFATAAVKDDCL